jgi:kynurenine formamidase
MDSRLRSWGVPLLAAALAGGISSGVILRAADDEDRAPPPFEIGESVAVPRDMVRDLSLTVAPEFPCVWPAGMTPMAVVPTATFGRSGRHRDMLVIDEHTGTQWDAPAHFVPPPDSGLPGAGPMGLVTGEKVPAWQFCGEACVIDVRKGRDGAEKGASVLVGPEVVREWEMTHRRLGPGDVVLFRSDYTDDFYKPFPEGERFVAAALRKEAPGWPAPTAATMDYLADRGVMTLGLDGASMGPLPNLAVATHQAGGKRGMVWVECATNLGSLPTTGAFFALLPAKHAGGSGGECRCVAITEPKLAAELIARARARRVVDLSVTLDEELPVVWPGRGPGEEGGRYVSKVLNKFGAARGPFFALTHLFDSMAGTHVVLPSFSLPANRAEIEAAEPAIRASVAAHEARFGPLPAATIRTDQADLAQLMGPAHVVDVRGLRDAGGFATDKPAGPVINRAFLEEHEAKRPFLPGEVVIFWSGYSDDRLRPLPAAPGKDDMFLAPLAGETEGWPQPTPEAVLWLAKRGIRCLGTDGPTLGGVDASESRSIDWMAATHDMAVVEYLTNVGEIAGHDAFFLFAPVKIAGTRGGYGRAIALIGD